MSGTEEIDPPGDDLADLRALKDAALANVSGDSLVDEYERGAIEMSWEQLTGRDGRASTQVIGVVVRADGTISVQHDCSQPKQWIAQRLREAAAQVEMA